MAFIMLKYVPFHFGESFYHEWIFNFVNAFSASIEMIIYVVSVFPFINVVDHIDWFVYVESSLWPWNESNLIMVYDPFSVLLDLVC